MCPAMSMYWRSRYLPLCCQPVDQPGLFSLLNNKCLDNYAHVFAFVCSALPYMPCLLSLQRLLKFWAADRDLAIFENFTLMFAKLQHF